MKHIMGGKREISIPQLARCSVQIACTWNISAMSGIKAFELLATVGQWGVPHW